MPSEPRVPTSTTVTGAASTLVAPLLARPRGRATVVGAHRFAVYLEMGARVVPVVTSDAVPLPTAVRLAVPSTSLRWGVAAGAEVLVGQGRVVLPGLEVVVARTWRPARVRRAVATQPQDDGSTPGHSDIPARQEVLCVLAAALPHTPRWLADGIRDALGAPPAAARTGGVVREVPAVSALVGRGPGLTPSGDDALAGALLVGHALGSVSGMVDAVRTRLSATTAVSAALLDAAGDGYGPRDVVTLVDASVAGDAAAVASALPRVLALGHTSGRDLVTGVRAALEAHAATSAPLRRSAA